MSLSNSSSPSPSQRRRSVVGRNVLWLAGGEVLSKVALLVTALVVARGLGAEALGTFNLSYGAALIFALLLSLGQIEVLIRESAAAPERARAFLASARRLQLRLAAVLVPIAALGALAVDDPLLSTTLLTFLLYAPLRTQLVTRGAAFKGLDRMQVEVAARSLEGLIALAACAALVQFQSPVWALGLAFAAAGAAAVLLLGRRLKELGPPAEATHQRSMLREGLPFLGLTLALQLLLRGETFLLEALGRPRIEVGYYSAAATVVWGLLALPQLLAVALYPTLSQAAVAGGCPRRWALRTGVVGVLAGTGVAGVLDLVREPLTVALFGASFEPTADLLSTLIWALPGAAAAMMLGVVAAAWRLQGWNLGVHLGTLLLAAGLLLAWIPSLGAEGAARAAVLAHSVLAVALFLLLALFGKPRKAA